MAEACHRPDLIHMNLSANDTVLLSDSVMREEPRHAKRTELQWHTLLDACHDSVRQTAR